MGNDMIDTVNKGITLADKIADIAKGLFGSSNYKKDEKTRNEGLQETIEKVKNSDLAMLYDVNGIKIISPKLEELYKNASKRMICHEIIKENNIEIVFEGAQKLLEEDKKAGIDCSSNSYVDKDFINQFFDIVGDVSNEDMQRIWTKLLAGEIKTPGKFSLRTLQKLKTISSDEAKLFEKISPFIIDFEYIPENTELLKKYGISFNDLIILDDCGIISLSKLQKTRSIDNLICNNSIVCVFKYNGENANSVKIINEGYLLTNFGKELLKIVNEKGNEKFLVEYINTIKAQYIGLDVSYHLLLKNCKDRVQYDDKEIIINI